MLRYWLPSFSVLPAQLTSSSKQGQGCTFVHALSPSRSRTSHRWGNENQSSAPKGEHGCSDPVQWGRELQWHQDFILENWIPLVKHSVQPQHKKMRATSNSSPGVCTQILRTNKKALLPGRKSLLPHLSDLHWCLIHTTCVPSFPHPHLQWFCSIFKWWKVKTCGYNFYEKLHSEGLLHFNFIATRLTEKKKKKHKSFQSFPNMKAVVKTFNKCKFSPASCWKIDLWAEVGKFIPTNVLYESHPRFYALHLIPPIQGGCGRVGQQLLQKFISVGRAYNKPFTGDLLREGKVKQVITSGLLRVRDQAKEGAHRLTHLPACGTRGTLTSPRSDVMRGNSGRESHQKTGKRICFFHSALCCWLDLCKTSSVPQNCPLGSVWH